MGSKWGQVCSWPIFSCETVLQHIPQSHLPRTQNRHIGKRIHHRKSQFPENPTQILVPPKHEHPTILGRTRSLPLLHGQQNMPAGLEGLEQSRVAILLPNPGGETALRPHKASIYFPDKVNHPRSFANNLGMAFSGLAIKYLPEVSRYPRATAIAPSILGAGFF